MDHKVQIKVGGRRTYSRQHKTPPIFLGGYQATGRRIRKVFVVLATMNRNSLARHSVGRFYQPDL
jgi:hypothetical protein